MQLKQNKIVISCPICIKIKGKKQKRIFPQFFILSSENRTVGIKQAINKCHVGCNACAEIKEKINCWILERKVSKADKVFFKIIQEYRKKFGLENKKIVLVGNGNGYYKIHDILLSNHSGVISEVRVQKAMIGALMNKPPDTEIVVI